VAEAMARQVALKKGRVADFTGAAAAISGVLRDLDLDTGVATVDGSGLSPRNQITPLGLARMVALDAAGKRPELRTVISGMPVGGLTGTLSERFLIPATRAGAGMVRAKTGTLNQVNTLAGLAYDTNGRLLSFAFMANEVTDGEAAKAALDRLASTLAACGC
jgi:D-alanyl-D-alanine carboxypeptidase/D-alanyl-D-alanine-endopeptidase (penicillin-binding protein 4)